MLEGLVAWVLNTYLGKYVENLNTDQLSIALLSGKVELENLPLKKDALRHLGLPIDIKCGFIGKIKLQIPVRQIRSAPWLILIEQLYLVATPLPLDEWDAESEKLSAHEYKLNALDLIEGKWRLENESKDTNTNYYTTSYSSWLSFGAGLVADIVENLQLKILDVHIRYEDKYSIPDKLIAFGITMESLTAQSCDNNWLPKFSSSTTRTNESLKLLDLKNFAIYWIDLFNNNELLLSNLSLGELAIAMSPINTNKNIKNYILMPVSLQTHFKRNRNEQPLRTIDTPRIVCDLLLDEVPLVLIDWQYDQIIKCIKGLDTIDRLRSYRRYKPTITIKENPKLWWLYPIYCFYPKQQLPKFCNKQLTLIDCLKYAKQNVEYCKIYKKILLQPNIILTIDEKHKKDEIEWERNFDELKILRELTMRNIKNLLPQQQQQQNDKINNSLGRNMLVRWFPQWMGWYSTTTEQQHDDDSSSGSNNETDQLEGELLQVLTDTTENNTFLKRDLVFGQFNFLLKRGCLSLCKINNNDHNDDNNNISVMLELEFKNLSLNILSKPRTSSHLIELSLGGLFLKDKITENTLFPTLIGPPSFERIIGRQQQQQQQGPSPRTSRSDLKQQYDDDYLFYICYEKKPQNINCDYRLCIRSKCLDIVYQPNAVNWLIEFLSLPFHNNLTLTNIEEMKNRTKKELIKNWEHIIDGHNNNNNNNNKLINDNNYHKIWSLEFDITAPQIIFVEQFTDLNSIMAIIDFGRFQLTNCPEKLEQTTSTTISTKPQFINRESTEEDEMFLTPCSTPPASEASDDDDDLDQNNDIKQPTTTTTVTEKSLYLRLYDCYCIELTDLQILIGKIKDNWRYALNKGTSTLHILDRFNILLNIEKRIIKTNDPLYPNLIIKTNLPKLIVHLNENKIQSIRQLINIIRYNGLPTIFKTIQQQQYEQQQQQDVIDTGQNINGSGGDNNEDESTTTTTTSGTTTTTTSMELSKLLILQFTIDNLSIELQSRGRCIAELQVSGVKMIFTKRLYDITITLTVHSLLLVDALQTYGPDFELLIASHKHVGMDTTSGSLRDDSEPTSPISPSSPDPSIITTTTTTTITQVLNNLSTSPPQSQLLSLNIPKSTIIDNEALITVEIIIIIGSEPVQIANIQFNNLDIIANQETIVELMGFIKRVFPTTTTTTTTSLSKIIRQSTESLLVEDTVHVAPSVSNQQQQQQPKLGSTELIFDFRRLNILLLRGGNNNNNNDIVGGGGNNVKKICTATMCDAKIQSIYYDTKKCDIECSLGGLQILDLTHDGQLHQRILSVGRDILTQQQQQQQQSIYIKQKPDDDDDNDNDDKTAFNLKIIKNLNDNLDIKIRMASLYYTHSPKFLKELKSCATEFKQYLTNLAKSIRIAATDMALNLVNTRLLTIGGAITTTTTTTISESTTPKQYRRRSLFDTTTTTPIDFDDDCDDHDSDDDDDDYLNFLSNIDLDIELDSPIVILPESYDSPKVFVAHLGKIYINNQQHEQQQQQQDIDTKFGDYLLEIRDMNLFSIDTTIRRNSNYFINKPEYLYNCKTLAKPILYDTIIQLKIQHRINRNLTNFLDCYSNNSNSSSSDHNDHFKENLDINGVIMNDLKVSLSRSQYEQLLNTLDYLTSIEQQQEQQQQRVLSDIIEEDTGVTTLNMDPHIRAKLFSTKQQQQQQQPKQQLGVKLLFKLPIFIIELLGDSPIGEQSLNDLTFNDFKLIYNKINNYETNIQISLRSILIEDLLQPENSKYRYMVVSSSSGSNSDNQQQQQQQHISCISHSCPDIKHYYGDFYNTTYGSLPDHLETQRIFGLDKFQTNYYNRVAQQQQQREQQQQQKQQQKCDENCPTTPPPSPTSLSTATTTKRLESERNLVLINTTIIDPLIPDFIKNYKSIQKTTTIDFNCLDLIVNIESWIVVLDFFSASSNNSTNKQSIPQQQLVKQQQQQQQIEENSEMDINIKSLTIILLRSDNEIAKANISNIEILTKIIDSKQSINGILGSLSLLDLTVHGKLYKERFLTVGNEQALQFNYVKCESNNQLDADAQLTIEMSKVMYIHTKRFIAEIQAFFNHFTQLHSVMKALRTPPPTTTINEHILQINEQPFKLSLILKAESSIILLPVHAKSSDLLIIDLGQLLLTNHFKLTNYNDDNDSIDKRQCLLDIMIIELENIDLYTGCKIDNDDDDDNEFFTKNGPSLLQKKFQLKLQVERNLHSAICHNVPDMSISGQLSTLDCCLDLSQYRLIRGLLSFNLSEDTEDILPSVQPPPIDAEPNIRDVWTLLSLKFNLQNVTLHLYNNYSQSPITCINFIKSYLTVENFSNFSQDIDLISHEILITDNRFDLLTTTTPTTSNNVNEEKPTNVFLNILKPIKKSYKHSNDDDDDDDLVQVEIHSRKRQDYFKYTILLNNMRLMAIFDWWLTIQTFLFQNIENTTIETTTTTMVVNQQQLQNNKKSGFVAFELKLNITDSEFVVVENAAQSDSNAVILKSTTVITYKPTDNDKLLSCNLNNCEMFSCILGDMENETALSIIDPVTLNIDINKNNLLLDIQLQYLNIKLSYYDMCIFMKILNSLPKQMLTQTTTTTTNQEQIKKLSSLGFKIDDCIKSLEINNNKLDDAAIWLTQYGKLNDNNNTNNNNNNNNINNNDDNDDKLFNIKTIEIKANYISICIIDDCGDNDVPLIEFTLQQFNLQQLLPEFNINNGYLECILISDYYNRILSGWEPFLEPWKCKIMWEKSLTKDLQRNRLNFKIESGVRLNINITSTIIELFNQVKENWLNDYYNNNNNNNKDTTTTTTTKPIIRRRSPFIPYAIKNETGSVLYFTTLITDLNNLNLITINNDYCKNNNNNWTIVESNQTLPFTFRNFINNNNSNNSKIRHQDSHKMIIHQIGCKIDGWLPIQPVTIDKVGVYFRTTPAQIQHRMQSDIPPARIVFDISLEGTARKLITVRSALLITNKLQETVELKLESQLPHDTHVALWAASRTFTLNSNETMAIPLVHVYSLINIRPINNKTLQYTYCSPILSWLQMPNYIDSIYEIRTCHTHKGLKYRFCIQLIREIQQQQLLLSSTTSSSSSSSQQYQQPGHHILLLPLIKLCNLLPIDLNYNINGINGRISGGLNNLITNLDLDEQIEFDIKLDNFNISNKILIPPGCNVEFKSRLNLEDERGRKLYLTATVTPNCGAKLKITISASYWIVNKTGLPLVFRQAGTQQDSAGQFDEHELARMVNPLLFSFSDHEASPTINARIGKYVIKNSLPQWCTNFHVQKGVQIRKLHVITTNDTNTNNTNNTNNNNDNKTDTVFIIGIEVRPGRGKYRSTTNIITISPRYQLYNHSSYKLLFTQNCFIKNQLQTTINKQQQQEYLLKIVPNSHIPFNWPRIDQPLLLCVSIDNIKDCCWSYGIKIDQINSLHINIRDINGRMYFLRLEILLKNNITFLIIFNDADKLPPPIRIDNFSEVTLRFGQTHCKDLFSLIRPHTSVPYAWDQPFPYNDNNHNNNNNNHNYYYDNNRRHRYKYNNKQTLTLIAPGNVVEYYDLNKLGPQNSLTYENFIYIAFSGTFNNNNNNNNKQQQQYDPLLLDTECQELVLDVIKNNQIILSKKQHGKRSQLWRMTPDGYLQHEGSNPPLLPQQQQQLQQSTNNLNKYNSNILVLDIENTAIQPNKLTKLMLRRIDPRRKSTQTWRFTDDGRLCCAHYNMCVQARDGFFGLRAGNSVVLGLPQPVCHILTDKGIPIEQAINRQRLRPGSGLLSINIDMDGPTRVLSIKDMKEKSKLYAISDDRDWFNISKNQRPNLNQQLSHINDNNNNKELQLTLNLEGVGISLICHKTNEELLYGLFSNIISEAIITKQTKQFCISIGYVQIDNQLFETPVPVIFYPTPPPSTSSSSTSISINDNESLLNSKLPTIDFTCELQQQHEQQLNAIIFKYFIIKFKKLTISLEERLLLKVFDFIGINKIYDDESLSSNDNDELLDIVTITNQQHHNNNNDNNNNNIKRYYFGVLQIILGQIRLSMKTTTMKLPKNLQKIKRKLNLTLITFEDAAVELEPFDRRHPFETGPFLINSIIKHFKDELLWQAGIILGSVDFLGNPLGFVNDVSEGFTNFLYEGNLNSLVKNVTHGISNSAVKLTETISDGLGRIILDDTHEEIRQKILRQHHHHNNNNLETAICTTSSSGSSSSSRDHLIAGAKSLGFGILGGATGIFKQIYDGAQQDGIPGVFSGIGKGLVGAVTKPVVGVLDFASETARAVRDSSRCKSIPERVRLPRCIYGPGGLLPRYSAKQSQGQQYLYIVNDKNYKEQLVGYEILGSASQDLHCIISNLKLRIVASTHTPELVSVIDCNLSDLETCNVITEKDDGQDCRYYIEIIIHISGTSTSSLLTNTDPIKRPRVRCKTIDLAKTVAQQINYAKQLYFERLYTLIINGDNNAAINAED